MCRIFFFFFLISKLEFNLTLLLFIHTRYTHYTYIHNKDIHITQEQSRAELGAEKCIVLSLKSSLNRKAKLNMSTASSSSNCSRLCRLIDNSLHQFTVHHTHHSHSTSASSLTKDKEKQILIALSQVRFSISISISNCFSIWTLN